MASDAVGFDGFRKRNGFVVAFQKSKIETAIQRASDAVARKDGLTFDSKGNLYIGNFADGTLHQVKFDAQGNPQPPTIFAQAPFMKSCDGIFCDLATDRIYVADSVANAVQVVTPRGRVFTLAQDPENDGTDGRLDQPAEVLIRGREVIASNFDFPVPGGVNTKFEVPNTLVRIPLD